MTVEEQLKAPFPEEQIEWRVARSGIKNGKAWAQVLAYVTNRAIMDRLDEVFTISGWANEFKDAPGGGILCGIQANLDDTVVTKWDGADKTNIEETKGGLSGAMKRAAVQWGIGRYLYDLDASFVQIQATGANFISIVDKTTGEKRNGYWDAPRLPEWALPKKETK